MTSILIKGEGAPPAEWDLKSGTVTIGRKPDNDLCLEDPTVSGHHAKIVTYFQSSYIEDLGSTNGTFVNGRRVRMHTLHSGDIVTVGKYELSFDLAGKGAAPAVEPAPDTVMFQQLPAAEIAAEEPPLPPEAPSAAPEPPQPDSRSGAYFQVMVGERAGQRVPILDEGTELSPGVRVSRRGEKFIVFRSEPSSKGVVRLNSRELDPAGAPLRDMDMLQVNSVWMAFFDG